MYINVAIDNICFVTAELNLVIKRSLGVAVHAKL